MFESHDWATCASCGVARNKGDQCDYCGTVYADAIKPNKTKSFLGSLSSKYQVSRRGSELRISWRWSGWSTLIMIPFFIFWNSMVFPLGSLFSGGSSFFSDPLSYFPVPGVHILVGILGPIYILIRLINRTTIVANKRHLIVKNHPIPWGKKHRFRAGDIQQLFVSKTQKSKKKTTWNVPELQLVTKNGMRHCLLTGNEEVEFADYETLRQQLSNALNIETVDVQGAFSD